MKILIVDDEHVWRRLVSIWLIRKGYQTVTCATGYEAISRLQKEHFDLLITDLSMPEMSGVTLREYVEDKYKIPVIVMSGYDKNMMESCNFRFTFLKSTGVADLYALIDTVLYYVERKDVIINELLKD
jgi:CheY-like chemotaxis protein